MRRPFIVFVVVSLAGSLMSAPAEAQSGERAYAGALIGWYGTDADHVTGTLASAGIVVGVRALPWLDVEIDVLKPMGFLTRDDAGESISFTDAGSSGQFVVTRFIKERRAAVAFSAGVVFHPRLSGRRFTPRVFAGLSNHRVRDRTVLEHLSLPPDVTIEQVNRAMPPEEWRTRNLGGPTVGGSIAVAITKHLSVAPDIRYDYGSIGDEINNVLRSSLRVFWTF